MIQKTEILYQLDKAADDFIFPMLDNGYYYHGDQKMTIFGDRSRWAILIEVLQFNNHRHDIEGITNITTFFGNCVISENNNDNFYMFAQNADTETFLDDEDDGPFLNPYAKTILIRSIEVPIVQDRQYYVTKGIELEYDDKIMPWEFMRGLVPEYSSMFWITQEEISRSIPIDLPVIMVLNKWHHPDLASGEKPSSTETFQQIAGVLLTGDISIYEPGEDYNTHWSNWPEGGML